MVSGSMNTVSEIVKSTQLAGTCDGWLMRRIEYAFTSSVHMAMTAPLE